MREIIIDKNIALSLPNSSDIKTWVKWMKDKKISHNTLRVPFPYREKDGKDFLKICAAAKKKFGMQMNCAIRNSEGELIGVIGFHGKYGKGSHKDEIGYWLAKPYRRKGIMKKVINRMCKHGFEKMKLKRIEASIFPFNIASMKLLQQCGFKFEGRLRKSYFKKGKYIDGMMYAKVQKVYVQLVNINLLSS